MMPVVLVLCVLFVLGVRAVGRMVRVPVVVVTSVSLVPVVTFVALVRAVLRGVSAHRFSPLVRQSARYPPGVSPSAGKIPGFVDGGQVPPGGLLVCVFRIVPGL